MNDEELFCKLFPDYAVNGKPLSPYFDFFESGCEQAENRIEELEVKIKKLTQHLEPQLMTELLEQVREEVEQEQKLKELEKENAKLKTDYEVLSCSVGDFGELQDKLEEEQRKNNGLSDNLTEAKEHITKLLGCLRQDSNEPETNYYVCQYMDKAEQFLKEIEQ